MSTLHNQLALAEQEDVARGVRLLLRHPLTTQRLDPGGFDLVRRRAQPLQQWFDYYCGWHLIVEPRLGYARLVKLGTADGSRPARRHRSGRAAFDRRRYVLFCVAAAELLAAPVTTIGLLADRVAHACAADPVIPAFDSSHRAERMALVDALTLLESLGVLEGIDGDADAYVDSAEAKVLFRVDATLLIRLLAPPRGPSSLATPPGEVPGRFPELLGRLVMEPRYGWAGEPNPADGSQLPMQSDVQRGLWLRHSTLRRLFDQPVLYLADLTSQQRDYLSSPTGRQILRRAARQAGFVLEERAEGYLVVDPDAISTDVTFPDDGSNAKVAALLLLDHLLSGAGPGRRRHEELDAEARRVLARFPSWAKAYRGDDGARLLVRDAVAVLTGFGLVRDDGDVVTALPAALRYAVSVSADGAEVTT